MKHRSVVANFIFRWTDHNHDRQNVALFKRSTHPDIRSYQGKYAPISGSVEENDSNTLAAAEREIKEETKLKPHTDITLEFAGKSFSFQDDQAQRSWTVYPFGWILEVEESKIQIDWEHSGWQWFNPEEILNGSMDDNCVPRLKTSLHRVYFGPDGMFSGKNELLDRSNPAGRAFIETFERLRTDTKSGARQLATEALRGLLAVCTCFREDADKDYIQSQWWHALRIVAYHFVHSARPSMNAAISAALVGSLSHIVNSFRNMNFDIQVACQMLEEGIAERAATSIKVSEALKSYMDSVFTASASAQLETPEQPRSQGKSAQVVNIITLSASSTILAALKHLFDSADVDDFTLNLTILQSHAPSEGTSLAASLVSFIESHKSSGTQKTKHHLKIKIIPDTHAYLSILRTSRSREDVTSSRLPTVTLLGADRITPTGHVVNKTGSAALAILTRLLSGHELRKTAVLSEEDKIAVPDARSLPSYTGLLDTQQDTEKLTPLSEQEMDTEGHESHSAAEVYATWPKKALDVLVPYVEQEKQNEQTENGAEIQVEVDNYYFEMVHSQYIDAYIGENGEMSREGIFRKSMARAQAEEKLFADLYN